MVKFFQTLIAIFCGTACTNVNMMLIKRTEAASGCNNAYSLSLLGTKSYLLTLVIEARKKIVL